jgi:hypothetical protein
VGDGTIQENHKSLAAPSIFFIVAAFQLAYYYLDDMNKVSFSFCHFSNWKNQW